MAHTEPSLNVALAEILSGMAPKSKIRAENTRVMREGKGLQPDILIEAGGRSPVIIEAEFMPAQAVEAEALSRLSAEIDGQTRPVEAVVALRYPADLKNAGNLNAGLRGAELEYCFFQEGEQGSMEAARFPSSGWLKGSVKDLSDLIRMISVPQKEVERAAEALERSIETAALILDEDAELRSKIAKKIAAKLGMSNGRQTRRMAAAIIVNALAFHERIAGILDEEIEPLSIVFGQNRDNLQSGVLEAWEQILAVDYYPIFSIAQDILAQMPSDLAQKVLLALGSAAQKALVTNAHELTGRVFQRLISDREYLAAYYTPPHSAALLARIAVSKLRGVNWKFRESIERLRIADFACGTGALLSAVYDQIAALHEREGGDLNELHPAMMETVLHGCDVMPSAAHITAATLSSSRPDTDYQNTHIYTMPYGRQEGQAVKLGSLELLEDSGVLTLFNTTDPARRTGRHGEETAERINVDIQDESFDLIIMNPPFVSNTAKDDLRDEAYAAAFAAFGSSIQDQMDMTERMKELQEGICYHGKAGMGSAFAGLGDRKLKPGGVLALVLPLTAVSAASWQKMRRMLVENYSDIEVLSIAAESTSEVSFSSDTYMAECLIIARKNRATSPRRHVATSPRRHVVHEPRSASIRFTSLRRRPLSFAHASETSNLLKNTQDTRHLNDGPYGGSPMQIGNELLGHAILMDVSLDGKNWEASRIQDFSLAQSALAITKSQLWLSSNLDPAYLKMIPLSDIARIGPTDGSILGSSPVDGATRSHTGPFDKLPYHPRADYLSLWNHNAQKEKKMVCEPDSQLQARQGKEQKAAEIWKSASRCHHSRDFRYNSQPLAVAFTEKKLLGGRAWPNVSFQDERFDYAFAIWGNCSLGLIMYWWHASRQHTGRGTITVTLAATLPILDLRTLTDDQLAKAERIFNDFREVEFQPAYIADLDPSRAKLDKAVLCDLLGFDENVYAAVRKLSAKWAAEPSVRGSKKRPAGALAV